jgi:hypothetical protein
LQREQFGEGQRQFDVGQGFREQQFGEGQRQFDVGQESRNRQLDIQRDLGEGNLENVRNRLEEETRRWDTNLDRSDAAIKQGRRDKQYGAGFKIAESLGFFDKAKREGIGGALSSVLGGIPGLGFLRGGGGAQAALSSPGAQYLMSAAGGGHSPEAVLQQMNIGGFGGGLAQRFGGGRVGALAQRALGAVPMGGTILGGLALARQIPGAGKIGGWAKKGLGKLFSDEDLKDNITPINEDRLLMALAETPVSSWQYKGDDKTHIGPMAQDFARFGTDTNEGGVRTIDVVDAFGVNFAANKALATKIKQHQKEIQQIRKPRHDWFN